MKFAGIFVLFLISIVHVLIIRALVLSQPKTMPPIAENQVIQANLIPNQGVALPTLLPAQRTPSLPTPRPSQPATKSYKSYMPDTQFRQLAHNPEKHTAPELLVPQQAPSANPHSPGEISDAALISPPQLNDAIRLSNRPPVYPAASRRLGEQGTVILKIYILADGKVGEEVKLQTSSGYRRLDDAAIAAVKDWRFIPAKRGDQAIAYWYTQTISFAIDR